MLKEDSKSTIPVPALVNYTNHALIHFGFKGKVAATTIHATLRAVSTVGEIEEAIARLSREEFLRLREWVQHRFDDEWDREFDADARSGALRAVAEAAIAEHSAGRSTPFPADEEQSRQ